MSTSYSCESLSTAFENEPKHMESSTTQQNSSHHYVVGIRPEREFIISIEKPVHECDPTRGLPSQAHDLDRQVADTPT